MDPFNFSQVHDADQLLLCHTKLGERLLHFGAADVDVAHLALKNECQELNTIKQNQCDQIVRLEREAVALNRRIEQLENDKAIFLTREQGWSLQLENKLLEERREWEDRVRELQKCAAAHERDTEDMGRRMQQQIQAEETEKYANSLQRIVEDKTRAEVQKEACQKENQQLALRLKDLEDKLQLQDLDYNVSANLGSRLEEQIVEYLQRHLGVMAEVERTCRNHCGDVWVKLREDGRVIMIDAKNASENALKKDVFLGRQDRNKFHEDIASNETLVNGAILFAKKRVHVTNTVDRYSPTVLFIGGGNLEDLLRGVIEVIVAIRTGANDATGSQLQHQQDMNMIVDSAYEVFEAVGQVCAYQSTTIKDMATIAEQYKSRKNMSVLDCVEKLQRVQNLCPKMVPHTFTTQIQVGTNISTAQKAKIKAKAATLDTQPASTPAPAAQPLRPRASNKRKAVSTIQDFFVKDN